MFKMSGLVLRFFLSLSVYILVFNIISVARDVDSDVHNILTQLLRVRRRATHPSYTNKFKACRFLVFDKRMRLGEQPLRKENNVQHLCNDIKIWYAPLSDSFPYMLNFIKKFERKEGWLHSIVLEFWPPSLALLPRALTSTPFFILDYNFRLPKNKRETSKTRLPHSHSIKSIKTVKSFHVGHSYQQHIMHPSLRPLEDLLHLDCGCSIQHWRVFVVLAARLKEKNKLVCPRHRVLVPVDNSFRKEAKDFQDFLLTPLVATEPKTLSDGLQWQTLSKLQIFLGNIAILKPSELEEYRAIIQYAVQRATTKVKSIVLLTEPKLLESVGMEIREKLADKKVMETHGSVFSETLTKRYENTPVLFVALAYMNNTQTLHFFQSLKKFRRGEIYFFMPYKVFEEFYFTVQQNGKDCDELFEALNQVDSYITRGSKMDSRINVPLSIYAVIKYTTQLYQKCYNMKHPQKSYCYESGEIFKQVDVRRWNNNPESWGHYPAEVSPFSFEMFSFNFLYQTWHEQFKRDRSTTSDTLSSFGITENRVIARKGGIQHEWAIFKGRYKIVMNLESPMVMVRNMTSKDDCKYGLPCTVDLDGERRCCFGLGIDIARAVTYLSRFSEYKDMKSNCEKVPRFIVEVDVFTQKKLWPNRKSNPKVTTYDDALLRHLTSGDYDVAIGSHVIVTSDNLNSSFVTKPFYSSPIGILISRKERLSSYRALTSFAAPFHWTVWLCVFITVNVTAVTCVFCEWHSPYGLTPNGRNRIKVFSFPSALNLCWSVLFSHTVATKSPKCWSCRFIINVYAFFCIIFFASYTGNLAAYMSGRRLLYEISGIHDPKLIQGDIRVATVYGSGTHFHLARAQNMLFKHAQLVDTVEEAFEKLRNREIDAFIYDIETLNYYKRVYHKDDFEIVGKPFAQISYAVAISQKFKKEGEKVRDCISRIVSVKKNQLTNPKSWYRDVPGILVGGSKSNFSIETQNFLGPLLLFLTGIVTGIAALIFEYIVFRTIVPICRNSLKDKRKILPFTQRLYRQMYTIPDYNKYTFTERNLPKLITPIAERLSNYRRPSAAYPVDIGKLLCSATERSLSTKSCPTLNDVSSPDEELTGKCAVASTDEVASDVDEGTKDDAGRALLPLTTFRFQKERPNLMVVAPTSHLYDSRVIAFESKQVNNMAVQTDIEAWVENRLAPVDANIAVRTHEFERDMKQMRGEVARLMKEKEKLLRRLQRYENKSREQMERDLLCERSASEEPLLRHLQNRLESSGNAILKETSLFDHDHRETENHEERKPTTTTTQAPPSYLTVINNLNV